MQALILASESPYRSALLSRLGLAFTSVSPSIDESRRDAEALPALAERLAAEKAIAVAHAIGLTDDMTDSLADSQTASNKLAESRNADTPDAQKPSTLIIASDQVAALGDQPLGKPYTLENARLQLSSMSGQSIDFFTALHILHQQKGEIYTALDVTRVTLRELDERTIERYLNTEKPLNCAGSFKVEALGISLFESVHSEDPTALIGLPLISVCKGLRRFGRAIP